MLADGKIESLDTHLEQFKLSNQTAQHELEVLQGLPHLYREETNPN